MKQEIRKLESKIEVLVHYIGVKVEEKDWHAVSDAANDIRGLTAKIEVLKEVIYQSDIVSQLQARSPLPRTESSER